MVKTAPILLALVAMTTVAWAQTGRTVRDVTVRGNSVINETAIKTAMRLSAGQSATDAAVQKDESEILGLGFFKKVTISYRNVGETQVDLMVDVEEYPIVKEVRIEGNTVVPTSEIEKVILANQEIGQIWNNRHAQPIVQGVKALYDAQGFFAEFEQLGPLDESPGTLNVKILEAKVGTITLKGLSRTRENTIRRMMKTKPGEAFNLEQFQRDLQELYYTYWFEDVKPSRNVGETPSTFDFTLEFKEARTAQLNVGVALDPQSRLVGTASYGDTNFQGRGQGVGLQLYQAATGGGPSVELAFSNRFYDSLDTSMSAKIFSKVVYNFTGTGIFDTGGPVNQADRFDERQSGFSLNFARPYGKHNRYSFGLLARNARTINLTTTTTDSFVQQDGDLVTMQLGWEQATTVPTVEPFAGRAFKIVLEPGYSNITKIGGNVAQYSDTLGQSMFLRSSLQYRQYWSKAPKKKEGEDEIQLDAPRPVLAFKAEYGNISGTVPFFEQLFVGGAGSLRGYDNQRFWGSQSLLTTLEYRHPIERSFSVVGFLDYGGAWGGYGEFGQFTQSQGINLKLGYGLGVAFRTPLGPIRIDFAFNQEGKSRTHFSFGTSF